MEAVADAAYEELPERARRAYGLLSLHPGTRPRFTAAAAAALLGEDAEGILEVLADRHLLEVYGRRYMFHDLVRLHAREQTGDDEAAVRRLIEYYLREAVAADATVDPERARDTFGAFYRDVTPGTSKKDALAWLDAEHLNLRSVVHEAAERGWRDLAWQLCEALWALYFSFKYYDDWVATHRVGLQAAAGDPAAEFRVGIQLGRALYETGHFQEAQDVLTTALVAAQELNDPRHVATALEFIGRTHEEAAYSHTDPQQGAMFLTSARDYFARALSTERSVANARKRAVAVNLHHVGRVELARGDLDAASSSLTQSHDLFAELGDDYNLARVLHTFAKVRTASGLDPVPLLTQALDLMRGEGRLFQEARILDSLAGATGDRSYAIEAHALYRRLGVSR